jgi:hypothetical protein
MFSSIYLALDKFSDHRLPRIVSQAITVQAGPTSLRELPDDLEAVIEPEHLVGGDYWNTLSQGLSYDLAVEGIGMMRWQVE